MDVAFVAPVFAAVFVAVFVATALAGAAFFSVTPFLVADVAFFTAMICPFKVALRHPANADRWREDKAIPPSTQWRNAA
jgi:hypothetical protein